MTGRSVLATSLLGGLATVSVQLPVFLVGATAVQLTDDLVFGAAGIGAAVAAYRLVGAATATVLGRTVDRLGARTSLRLGCSIGVVCGLGIALLATSWTTLVLWLLLAACANSLTQPAANRLVVNRVPAERQGIAFGVKQSALPASSMLAGASVPLIAVTVGWRWSYVAAAVIAVLVLAAVPRRSAAGDRSSGGGARGGGPLRDRGTLLVLAVGLGTSIVASNTIPAFYVDSASRIGTSPDMGGTLLAVASLAAIVTRLALGGVSDRIRGGHLRICAALMAVGAVGLAAMALGADGQVVAGFEPAWLMAGGLIVGLAGTWGTNGVFWFAVVRAWNEAPGRVTGVVMPAGAIGAIVGPMTFGVAAESVGYAAGWWFTVGAALVSAGVLLAGAARLRARVGRQEAA